MWEVVRANPWLIIVCMALSIPILGIVFGTVTSYLTAVRRVELDASLKQEMLQRGMSAEEIKTVVKASSPRKRCGRDRTHAC